MNIYEYKEQIIENIKFLSSVEKTTDKEEFINHMSAALIEAEIIDDFTFLPFEGIGKRRRKIQIDGYSYNELDEYLTIFIVPPLTYFSDETLINSEADKYFSRAQAFIEDADFIIKNAEESSPGYGLAVDILKKYCKVRKFSICLLTDMVTSIKELQQGDINGIPIEYNIWDINRFFQMSESASGKEDVIINLKEFIEDGIPCLTASQTNDYTAYLCNIPGILLAKIYNKYGGRLLEGNVRSFLQTKGKVNKGIRNTILNDPTMFFAYNNGIAATAHEVVFEKREAILYMTQITSLQIVNGGQTTASLAMALLNDKKDGSEEKLNEIYVPMKLSIVSPEKSQELIPNISKYANSQNKVSDADLWSNHPFHIRMEDFSRRVVAPSQQGKQYGTHWYYERANGQYKQETYRSTLKEKRKFEMLNPQYQMFKKTDLAKYVNLMLMQPDIASAGGQKSFSKFAIWVTKQWEANETMFNEGFFRRIISIAIIYKETDRIVKQQPWYNSYKANIVSYSIAILLYKIKENHSDKSIDYKNIWLKQTLSNAWKMQMIKTTKEIYDFLIDENRLVENVTEWAKRDACWSAAKRLNIELLPEFIEALQMRKLEKEDMKSEKKDQQLTNRAKTMVEVANFGVANWRYLLEWDSTHNVLTHIEKRFINSAIEMENGKFPSEKQCIKIMEVLDRARIESFPK